MKNLNTIYSQIKDKSQKEKANKLFDILGYTKEYREVLAVNKKDYENEIEELRKIRVKLIEEIKQQEEDNKLERAKLKDTKRSNFQINEITSSDVKKIKQNKSKLEGIEFSLKALLTNYPKFFYLNYDDDSIWQYYLSFKEEEKMLKEKIAKNKTNRAKFSSKLGMLEERIQFLENLYVKRKPYGGGRNHLKEKLILDFGKNAFFMEKYINRKTIDEIYEKAEKELKNFIKKEHPSPELDKTIKDVDERFDKYHKELETWEKIHTPIFEQKINEILLESELGKYLK